MPAGVTNQVKRHRVGLEKRLTRQCVVQLLQGGAPGADCLDARGRRRVRGEAMDAHPYVEVQVILDTLELVDLHRVPLVGRELHLAPVQKAGGFRETAQELDHPGVRLPVGQPLGMSSQRLTLLPS